MRALKVLIPVIIILAAFLILSQIGHNVPSNLKKEEQNIPVSNSLQRIVSLAPNITEILFELGLGEKVVAVSNNSDYPPQAIKKTKIGSFWHPNIEAIIAAKPDIIITTSSAQQKTVAENLRRLNYKVLTVELEKSQHLWEAIGKIGAATECKYEADKLIEKIKSRINTLQSALDSNKKVRVLWVIQPEPLRVIGRKTFINELIEMANGENVIGHTVASYPLINAEEIIACNAEVIIQSAMSPKNIARQQENTCKFWSKWSHLPAVKKQKIYVIYSDTVLRLGPRLPEGLESIARYLHPKTFEKNNTPK
ncbi:MAG: ABC transporter substrate-binding protein [Planctomycetota bacterium]|jgi:iron complex transport system substrate-binding protein